MRHMNEKIDFETEYIRTLKKHIEALQIRCSTLDDCLNHAKERFLTLEKKYLELQAEYAILSSKKKRRSRPGLAKMKIVE